MASKWTITAVLNKLHKSSCPFDSVKSSMKPLFDLFGRFLAEQAVGFVPEIREAAKGVIRPNGKLIRPTLVFSSMLADADAETAVRRAAIVELTHISTLVHDDVIDNATLRRNCATTNAKYGVRTAILLGDVIFSHMMSLAFADADRSVAELTSRYIRIICEGEIRQTLSDKNEIVSPERYFEIVYGKTAALFELSCRLGAMSAGAPRAWVEAASEAGKQLGIAYQIYDDVCDWFMSETDAGKTLGTDLVSGKQTFPLIALMRTFPKDAAADFLRSLPDSDFATIRAKMTECGALETSEREFLGRISAAENALAAFPQFNAKLLECCAALREMDFVK